MKKQKNKEWFENEPFWIEMYPYLFSEKRFTEAFDQVDKIIKLLKLKKGSVLDLCCGPGRCSIAFAKKGFSVTGVDRNRYFLDKGKAKARSAKVKIEWIKQDMRDFVRPGSLDFILSMFTSFGYFDDKQEDLKVMKNMYTNLKPGGSCLIDLFGKEILAKIFQHTNSEELPDGSTLVQRHKIIDDWNKIRNEWILIRKGRAKSFKFDLNIYSGQEMKELLEQAGFKVKLYGNLDGDSYGSNAQRLVVVGRKPD